MASTLRMLVSLVYSRAFGARALGFGLAVVLLASWGTAPAQAQPVGTLFSVATNDDQVRTVDPATGATLSSIAITVAADTVTDATGLAMDPGSGTVYVLLRLTSHASARDRTLATLDTTTDPATGAVSTTGVATVIGVISPPRLGMAGLAFDCTGTLYAVSGDGGNPRESFFTLNTTTGAATYLFGLGRGDDGETIAFNAATGRMFHASGHVGDYVQADDDGVIFESFDAAARPLTDIPIAGSALTAGETRALTFSAAANAFLWVEGTNGLLYRVTAAGAPTLIGPIGPFTKGLAFVGATLHSITSGDDQLRTINPADASTVTSVTITLAGQTVFFGNGLATDPTNGTLYAIVRTDVGVRRLVTIIPGTGVATDIGDLGDSFAGLAFDTAGNLFGVTGAGANLESALFQINKATAAPTYIMGFRRGDGGEALGFNPNDSRLYHAAGNGDSGSGDYDPITNTGGIFESVNPAGIGISDIPITTPLTDEEAQAITFSQSENLFYWKQNHGDGPLFTVTPAGAPTQIIDFLGHQAKGLAFVGAGVATCGPIVEEFTVSGSPSSQTVEPGETATYEITVDGGGANPPAGDVTLACTNVTPLLVCTFTPNPVTPAGGLASSRLDVNTDALFASLQKGNDRQEQTPLYAFWLGLPGLALVGLSLARGGRKRVALVMAVALLVLSLLPLGGCSEHRTSTQPFVFDIVITGTTTAGTSQLGTVELIVNRPVK